MYGKWASFIFLLINLVKLNMLPKSIDKPQENPYFREMETKKVRNPSDHHYMLVHDITMH